jgi:hypothetical protein
MKSNPTLALMRSLGIPETRKNYLELAYLQENPELSAEEEAELPEQFQLPVEHVVVRRTIGRV